ncbi:MAG: YeeE/YedE thiosulfate transporter family protein [Bacteroidales bacterium]
MENTKADRSKRYWNPYFGGVMLGLLLLATFYITGRGLGASGAAKSTVVAAVNKVAPQHAAGSAYYSKFISDDHHPLNQWLVFEVIGILAGSLLSGALAGRLKLKVEHSPKITSRTRLIMAALGGVAFGVGSQLARGCTSGAALSGMATLSLAGFVSMLAIFGSAYAFAWFFRKLWI